MPTDEERREVAAKLREHAKTARRVGCACVLKKCTHEEECDSLGIAGCEECFDKSLKRLADLIEPEPERTCHVVSTIQREYYIEGQAVFEYETELSCGHKVTDNCGDVPNFCPNCGSRVIA